jgi:hypothetical protein
VGFPDNCRRGALVAQAVLAIIITHREANFGLKIPIRAIRIYFRTSAMPAGRKRPVTNRRQNSVASALLVACLGLHSLAAQTAPYYGANAKACKLMPTPDLEASYGGKVTNPHGSDEESSVCTVNIRGVAIKLQSAPPGTAGVPTSIRQGLMGARLMLGEAKQSPEANRLRKSRMPQHENDKGIRRQTVGQALAHYVVLLGRRRLPEFVGSRRKSQAGRLRCDQGITRKSCCAALGTLL